MRSNYFGSSRKTSSSAGDKRAARLAAWLLANRHSLAFELMKSLAGWEKYDRSVLEHGADLDAFVQSNFHVFIDYLSSYFKTGDIVYKHLYIHEKLKELYDLTLTSKQDDENRRRVTEGDRAVLCGRAAPRLDRKKNRCSSRSCVRYRAS